MNLLFFRFTPFSFSFSLIKITLLQSPMPVKLKTVQYVCCVVCIKELCDQAVVKL